MTRVHTPEPKDERLGAAGALAGSLLNRDDARPGGRPSHAVPGGPATPDAHPVGVPATRACGRTGPAGPPESFEVEVAGELGGTVPANATRGGPSASNPSCRDGELRGGWLAVPADTLDLWFDTDEDQWWHTPRRRVDVVQVKGSRL